MPRRIRDTAELQDSALLTVELERTKEKRTQVRPRFMRDGEQREKFRQGVEQFNSGRFFDAHETWEEIWLGSTEPDKTFLQGIIQIAAAFHHYTRGNMRGTRSLLEAGLRRVAHFPAIHREIALDALRATAHEWAAALAEDRDPGPAHLPKIQYAPDA